VPALLHVSHNVALKVLSKWHYGNMMKQQNCCWSCGGEECANFVGRLYQKHHHLYDKIAAELRSFGFQRMGMQC